MTIIDVNHDNLESVIGIRSKAAVTIWCSPLSVTGLMDSRNKTDDSWSTVFTYSSSISYHYPNWSECERRAWCNNNFYNGLSAFTNLIKPVVKINRTFVEYGGNSECYKIEHDDTIDKVFLLSMNEVTDNLIDNFKVSSDRYEYISSFPNDVYYRSPLITKSGSSIYIGFVYSLSSMDPSTSYENQQIRPAFCL